MRINEWADGEPCWQPREEENESSDESASRVPTTPDLESETEPLRETKGNRGTDGFGSSDSQDHNTEEFDTGEQPPAESDAGIRVEDLLVIDNPYAITTSPGQRGIQLMLTEQQHDLLRSRSKSPGSISRKPPSDFHSSFLKFGLWPEMSYQTQRELRQEYRALVAGGGLDFNRSSLNSMI